MVADMNEPSRIARALMNDSFACPAAILVALGEDGAHLGTLERRGCLSAGRATPFTWGQR